MRQKTTWYAQAMYAGGLALLLLAALPLAAALLFFCRAALVVAVPVVAIAALASWTVGPGDKPVLLGPRGGRRTS